MWDINSLVLVTPITKQIKDKINSLKTRIKRHKKLKKLKKN